MKRKIKNEEIAKNEEVVIEEKNEPVEIEEEKVEAKAETEEVKPNRIESILLYQDYQKLCVSDQRLWEVQHASISD